MKVRTFNIKIKDEEKEQALYDLLAKKELGHNELLIILSSLELNKDINLKIEIENAFREYLSNSIL